MTTMSTTTSSLFAYYLPQRLQVENPEPLVARHPVSQSTGPGAMIMRLDDVDDDDDHHRRRRCRRMIMMMSMRLVCRCDELAYGAEKSSQICKSFGSVSRGFVSPADVRWFVGCFESNNSMMCVKNQSSHVLRFLFDPDFVFAP